MINKTLTIILLLFSFQVLGDRYALIVITDYKGDNVNSVSHVSLYKSKNICSSKLDDINFLLSKGASMGVKYKAGILSAKYKNLEKTYKCVKISKEFKTDY